MEEVWQNRYPDESFSVHMRQFPETDAKWLAPELAVKWTHIRAIRRVVTGALEIERREKRIGSSLEAAPIVYVDNAEAFTAMQGVDMADVCITSQIELRHETPPGEAFIDEDSAHIGVVPALAVGEKCQRSWKIHPDVGSVAGYPDLTPRDAAAVQEYDAQAQ